MSSNVRVKSLRIRKLHGIYDYNLDFNEDLTIFFGENGVGKTMMLHIISNLLDGDLQRFFHIEFNSIELVTSDILIILYREGESVIGVGFGDMNFKVYKDRDDKGYLSVKTLIWRYFKSPPVYMPAFRVILEAASRNAIYSESEYSKSQIETLRANEVERHRIQEFKDEQGLNYREDMYLYPGDSFSRNAVKTVLCRNWFGPFVPFIRTPSLVEISEKLFEDSRRAQFNVSRVDRSSVMDFVESTVSLLVNEDSVNYNRKQILKIEERINDKMNKSQSMSKESSQIYMRIDPILANIRNDELKENQSKIGMLLKTYELLLDKQIELQNVEFRSLNLFQTAINQFLKNKTIDVISIDGQNRQRIRKLVKIQSEMYGFNVLSSGERHILTLIYSVSSISENDGILMIDEPEISMHVAWQRKFASFLAASGSIRQTIICTHSPEIAAEFRDKLVRMEVKVAE